MFLVLCLHDCSQQSSVPLPNVDPNFRADFTSDGTYLLFTVHASIDYNGRYEIFIDGNRASSDWNMDGIEEYQSADPDQMLEGFWMMDGTAQYGLAVGEIYTEDFWDPYCPCNHNDIHTLIFHQVGDGKYAASDFTYNFEFTKIIPDVPVVIDSSDPEFPYPVMRKTISSGNSTVINWNINPAFSGQTLTFKIRDDSHDYDHPLDTHTAQIENGTASLPIGVLPVGKYYVYAEYSGDQSVFTGPNHFVSTGECELIVEN